ncbi:polysaccharide pyruvyl transferase family protein [Streptomyces jeddahensis]|uniref:Polysaccharide pyruvyl transferase n=1 Tax=Streptomyces jeddahensis TaxID=1716141 RepID=A0A177HS30_9ACTN|nr:polysaccharide pyruvyl transferase family protein [Streptomyces jeddahensis]OAH13460.1 polysaccharide pyruvyl transferase [Streptomyces jeddahensis]
MNPVLLTGWFSFFDGEVTAGDELALRRVQETLDKARVPYDTVWSRGFRPEALHLEDVDPGAYRVLVFVCGPLYGPQIEDLHRRFGHCLRVAVGTSVVDPRAPAATGFHHVLARCGAGGPPAVDLGASATVTGRPPVAGVILTHGQHEYGARRRHAEVADALGRWLAGKDAAYLPLDTRLARDDFRSFATPEQLVAVFARLDVVVTDRLHGMVLALQAGTPALAVDPVHGGAKVTAQARACRWPAVLPAEGAVPAELDRWWTWCLTEGRTYAEDCRRRFTTEPDTRLTDELLAVLSAAGW